VAAGVAAVRAGMDRPLRRSAHQAPGRAPGAVRAAAGVVDRAPAGEAGGVSEGRSAFIVTRRMQMPLGNRSGPAGAGPMTGRAAGFCAGFGAPGHMNPAAGVGFGRGCGWGRRGAAGRGWRNMFWATGQPGWMRFGRAAAPPPAMPTADAETETEFLRQRADFLQAQVDEVSKRIADLSGRARTGE